METEATFGKYKGRMWGEIMVTDPTYVSWVLKNCDSLDEESKEELKVHEREGLVTFGKYKNKPYETLGNDTKYLEWVVQRVDTKARDHGLYLWLLNKNYVK
jgi:uncharacterized protein (DUF3820 family)